MRIAAFRARKSRQSAEAFAHQQAFDRGLAELVAGDSRAQRSGGMVRE